MRRVVALFGLALIAAGAVPFIVAPATSGTAKPEGPAIVMVPASDGYGFGDCLATGAPCGQVVADAWCGAHGYGKAIGFGASRPEDVTGSTITPVASAPKAQLLPAASQHIAVTCAN